MLLCERISELLTIHKKTTPQLARYSGVTPQAAHKWVTGQSEPRGTKRDVIAEFFGISRRELEYGALPLLANSKPEATKVNEILSNTLAEHSASLVVESELRRIGQKSAEYILGMKHYLLSKLVGAVNPNPFRPGTCQRDAYEAGYAHGKLLAEEIDQS